MSQKHELNFNSGSPDHTARFAAALARVLRGGEIILLEGQLGAGKTFLVKSLAAALGTKAHVTSPTFVLQRIYDVDSPQVKQLLHYDLYRIGSYEELVELGFEDAASDAVSLVEWGEKFRDRYVDPVIEIQFEITGDTARTLAVVAPDAKVISEMEGQLWSARKKQNT